MKNKSYWKIYPVATAAEEIEGALSRDTFSSCGVSYELLRFYHGGAAPGVLITPGAGGHAYVFAELGYLVHKRGFNVFIMPRHGGYTITELSQRHRDAVDFIHLKYESPLHLYGEGLGGLVIFYLALAGDGVKSIICENAPALLTDQAFHTAVKKEEPAGKRRSLLLPLFMRLAKLLPRLPVPIKSYLAWKELIDEADPYSKGVEERLVKNFTRDPDFDTHYPLRAVLSLVGTPPPRPLSALTTPTLFILAKRGLIPSYFKTLFAQLPVKTKKLIEVDGGAYWMLSHPKAAAEIICSWMEETGSQQQFLTFSTIHHENSGKNPMV